MQHRHLADWMTAKVQPASIESHTLRVSLDIVMLVINRADGQDTETGLFTPVLQHPSSVQRQERGTSVIPGGGFLSACALSSQREGALFPVLPGSQEDRRIQAHSGSSMPEPAHCMQEVPYVNYEKVTETGAARRLVHNRPEERLLSW